MTIEENGQTPMFPTKTSDSPWKLPTHKIDYRPYAVVTKVGVVLGATASKPFSDCLGYGVAKGNQIQRMQIITDALRSACNTIESLCPPSRERSLALTDLQSARMFANASIILHETGDE